MTSFRDEMDKFMPNQVPLTPTEELRESMKNILTIQNTLFTAVMQIRTAQEADDERIETLKDLMVTMSEELASLKNDKLKEGK